MSITYERMKSHKNEKKPQKWNALLSGIGDPVVRIKKLMLSPHNSKRCWLHDSNINGCSDLLFSIYCGSSVLLVKEESGSERAAET